MSMVGRQTFTIKRNTASQTNAMGGGRTASTGNRGTLPTTWKASEHELTPFERNQYMLRDIEIDGKLFGESDPQVNEKDELTNPDGETLYVEGIRQVAKLGRLYIVEYSKRTTGAR